MTTERHALEALVNTLSALLPEIGTGPAGPFARQCYACGSASIEQLGHRRGCAYSRALAALTAAARSVEER